MKRTVGEIYDENEMFKIYEKDGRSKKTYGLPILPSPHKVEMNPNTNQIDDNGNVKLEGSIPINKNAWQFSWQETTQNFLNIFVHKLILNNTYFVITFDCLKGTDHSQLRKPCLFSQC